MINLLTELILLLAIIWFGLCYIQYRSFAVLRTEISYLKPLELTNPPSPFLGVYLNELLPELRENSQSYELIVFAMPDCYACHAQTELLIDLQEKHGQIPMKVILFYENNITNEFLDKYQGILNINVASVKKVKDLIQYFPSFFIIDAESKIIFELPSADISYNTLRNLLLEDKKDE